MKQTAVEFAEELIKVILYYLDDDELQRIQEVFDEAKEMEKQHIIDAQENGQSTYSDIIRCDKSKKYYNETFNK